ncbi:MAG: hypothetical protein ACI4IE_07465 [Eubacterium sp.]
MLNIMAFISTFLMGIEINASSWKQTLPAMGFGMLCIFIVIGIIIVATYLINKAFSKNKDKEEK